ncbi:tyrosine-type recombinase/integrase [Weizmannia sp. CD-2023]|uniref:tyrosine-type recombinase/integrase n=1 Tax=Heyndrickxia TaxID=2837504 RepID=UPI002E2320F6|nr:tyrosine-type recombinase/integrase [Weizmannia sp. CD-2023]MED4840424.1 tyrosine-type recombinase/integrase [Weizmannia sp. CD-2023]MED4899739.1 tyrosine-type recombinase/integrase [Weizmannia sp. CD-2023]
MRRKNTLTQAELAKVHVNTPREIDFQTALNLFLDDCALRNLREHTLKFYAGEITTFKKILEEQGIDTEPHRITEKVIENNLILYMKEQGLKTVTINTRLRAIRAFFNFLEKKKFISNNPMKDIHLLKDRRHVVETFSKEQLHSLLNAPDMHTFTGVRDYTIMCLLLETGIRANELIGIDLQDVRIHEGEILIKHAKTYRERIVPIQKEMRRILKNYVAIRGIVETQALFITIDGTRLTKRQLQNRIAFYGHRAGLHGVRCSPHTFRHTFAKESVKNGAGIFELQQILGHTSMEMVRVYVNLFSEDVKQQHKKFSPLKTLL